MPISKIGSKGVKDAELTADDIAPGTITSPKIAPRTIANDRMATDPTNASNLASGTVANARLTGSGAITINGNAVSLGGSVTAGTDYQSVVTTNTTMVAGKGYFVDSSGGTITMTLPASPSLGDEISIAGLDGASNAVTIARNGNKIEGGTADLTISTNYGAVTLVYTDTANGWYRHNNEAPEGFIQATGGTESTSGDFKIHVFNSTSNFVVSGVATTAANNEVSYLVAAGGGGGGQGNGGGGGAGGVREGKSGVDSYTQSPLNSPSVCIS